MDSYIDIHLRPDAEMNEAELGSKVYTKFHKALVKLNTNQIAISFPDVNLKLGQLFRVHGPVSLLNDLQGLCWLGPLSGYCQISEVLSVPEQVQYRVISAKRRNLSAAKLRRLIARGSINKEGEQRYKKKMLNQSIKGPYLDLLSSSTGQKYRKFFEFGEIQDVPVLGNFDTYGLSLKATVPWF
ncbi:type I-F CRISPR-associated endoribonuclease Cas6/Csy4 [Vibrio mimicus]|uniref:type I-F CRISPR-associated endoribonuclease Cas6/Csy4 n=1 Tax=Vibrio cholerae TaxID=666 RepID=UPI001E101EFC|nr:type I-F CRISPR-associated endoribonuclease Cas6/Csy4 [Vibrio cholerae]EGS7960319.1 type I-F CRISPR-associated endoribonuclease Cas6/Csy4 [Vibrio cholerae]EJH6263961.1 type I-F CRISPR-associated endoribonuclease Cas6/Csy4 [Vibrio cholerae]EJL6627347.1 type I-F CRISPR-associated endoribonuclease Cas6/Csy4 [Vibrio cholerae]EJT3082253.1 type I-F CRISPR-associated endoribonuclease Cas6/Csy4 [Vibrio cholerae]